MRILLVGLLAVGCTDRTLDPGGATPRPSDPPTPPTTCGGDTGATCGNDQYCHFPSSCGGTGTCVARPTTCGHDFQLSCGCDGGTYTSPCEARRAGTDVAFDGACPRPPAKSCGGELGPTCAGNEYCDFPVGQMCDWADGSGVCKPRPDACTDEYAPVCGCDRKDYGNACEANAAGVGVAYPGACDCRQIGCPTGKKCELCWTTYECLDANTAC